VRLGPSEALVKPETVGALDQLAARVLDVMQSRGCANTTELIDDARAIFGRSASSRFTEAALRSGGPFEWLDRNANWFWYIGGHGAGSNRLIDQIQRVLAATPRIRLTRLRSAIRRNNRLGFAPPIKVLEFVCRHLLFARLEGDSVARVPGITKLGQGLTSDEQILIDVLQAHGPVLEHQPFMEHCGMRGLDETSVGIGGSELSSPSLAQASIIR
jgi:hypothetical protein